MLLLLFAILPCLEASEPVATPSPPPSAPVISSLLKPALLGRALEEREILTHADLDEGKRYAFYTVMLVRAGLSRTREVLTDYRLYAQMVPYIERAEYDLARKVLSLIGGIWKFRLESSVRFDEQAPGWIRYHVIGGHFAGLMGDILFEGQGEKGTLVMMRGGLEGNAWPPALVIEQGAQIVFGFTAKRMRSYLEKK